MSSLFVNNTKQRLRIYIFILLSLLSVLLYTFICVYTLENGLTLVNIHIVCVHLAIRVVWHGIGGHIPVNGHTSVRYRTVQRRSPGERHWQRTWGGMIQRGSQIKICVYFLIIEKFLALLLLLEKNQRSVAVYCKKILLDLTLARIYI